MVLRVVRWVCLLFRAGHVLFRILGNKILRYLVCGGWLGAFLLYAGYWSEAGVCCDRRRRARTEMWMSAGWALMRFGFLRRAILARLSVRDTVRCRPPVLNVVRTGGGVFRRQINEHRQTVPSILRANVPAMSNAFTGTPQAHGSGSELKSAVVTANDQMRTTHRDPRSAHQVLDPRIAAGVLHRGRIRPAQTARGRR